MKYALLLATIFVALLGCRKSKPTIYPVKEYEQFEYEGLSNFSGFRLFTKAGEINDQSLVASYVQQYDNHFYTPASNFSAREYRSFSVVGEDSIINTGIAPAGELKRTRTDAYDVFMGKYNIPQNDTNAIALHLGKYKLFTPATTTTGYSYYELNSPPTILKRVGDKMYLPIIRYIITYSKDYTFSFSSDKINNVLDPTAVRKLGNNDTLLVQSFDVVLKKK
jgi:hypothetical protein